MKTDEQKAEEILKAFEPLKGLLPKHSPLPWEYKPEVKAQYNCNTGEKMESRSDWVYGSNDKHVCITNGYANGEGNAKHIVHAVNILPELIEALDFILASAKLSDEQFSETFDLIQRAKGDL